MILSILLSIVFFILGLIHFYWVIGGRLWLEESLPINEKGEKVLNPKKLDSALVGFGLTAFGFFYLFRSGLMGYELPDWIMLYGAWIIPAIFILRSIGEFKYIGFFKKIKKTKFAKRDTMFFSPLCLVIGLSGLLLAFII